MAEPADATGTEEEDFERLDEILALEGGASDRLDHFQAVARRGAYSPASRRPFLHPNQGINGHLQDEDVRYGG